MHQQENSQWTVIKLGGSILVPDLPDTEYLREFRKLIRERVEMGEKFLIIVGGGKICRHYQKALLDLGTTSSDEIDWMGIYTLRFNAELVRLSFEESHPKVLNSPDEITTSLVNESVVICGADAPGHSTNYDGVVFAQKVGAKTLLNLSNIDYVYSDDPRKNPEAIKYEEVGWEKYLTFIPKEWSPGLSVPFDQAASHKANEYDIDVIFMKGNPIDNLKKYFETGEVEGSVISNRFA